MKFRLEVQRLWSRVWGKTARVTWGGMQIEGLRCERWVVEGLGSSVFFEGVGSRVSVLGLLFKIQGMCRVLGLGFRDQGQGIGVQVQVFRVLSFGFGV